MIIYSSGDIFESSSVALVNAVNCQGVMGKGIAYQFKVKFPENYIIYKKACDDNRFKIGDILITSENEKIIVNFPTKDSWRKKSQYDYIEKGLLTLKQEIIKRNIPSISLPPLGCGNGGLDWECVENMITSILSDLDSVEITIYPPVVKKDNLNNESTLNTNHLLVCYAMTHLKDKKRYSLNTLFYLCQKLSKYNYFDFNIVYGRALDAITDDIKRLKLKYGDSFDEFINDFVNTHLSKKMEDDFKKIIPEINIYIKLLNTLEHKEEFSEIIDLIEMFSNKEITPDYYFYRNKEIKEVVVAKMLDAGIIQKNIFDQYELTNPILL